MSGLTFEDYLRVEAAGQRFVSLKLIHVDIAGDLVAGVLLSQLIYWHRPNQETGDPRLTFERDGHLWLRKAYDEWHKECRLTSAQARRAFEHLRERGLVETRVWKHNGTPKLHIRIVPEAFMEAFTALSPQVKAEMRHSANGNAPQRKSEMRASANPLPTEESTKKKRTRSLEITTVYDAWKDGTGRNGTTKLTSERRTKINARLDDGYTVQELVTVVTRGWRADPWAGRVDQNDLVVLLRDGSQVEKFLDLAGKARRTPQQSERDRALAATAAKLDRAEAERRALSGART